MRRALAYAAALYRRPLLLVQGGAPATRIRELPVRHNTNTVVHRVDLGPAERYKPIPHGILQRLALATVQNLVSRRLPHIEDRFACQMV